jgi:hypothetical protein
VPGGKLRRWICQTTGKRTTGRAYTALNTDNNEIAATVKRMTGGEEKSLVSGERDEATTVKKNKRHTFTGYICMAMIVSVCLDLVSPLLPRRADESE